MRLQHPAYGLKSGFQMYWSAGALVALLCGDTVTLSNEDKFPERINKVYKILKKS